MVMRLPPNETVARGKYRMNDDPKAKPPIGRAILTDPQFWIPLGVLALGILILAVVAGGSPCP